ncbi:MAG: ATP-binding protein [Bacteroidales bacterium]|jgi:nicotinamide riboside kinase|nr:ATP-binding protein [Bacteroidales bacterium]MDD2204895.1 ATP-binding protein [Bacteroidales bacterium]MDD3151548.1 ATP-binding protein [Bacteroidales bacterium]MDD3913551.1 ATP-binding protein [Bacteroidales bacterium]MDD4634138.1 ATP-binding protein [Bacteroidales bacterium]
MFSDNYNEKKIIVLTGPESTGKTTLGRQLAQRYNNGVFVPEYAREYVEKLQCVNRSYTYEDVETIAQHQVTNLIEAQSRFTFDTQYVFVDTYLIITKIWFIHCYKSYPQWIDESLRHFHVNMVLLCKPDLPWKPDPVRENGDDEMRNVLYNEYLQEIKAFGFPYSEIGGVGEERLQNALAALSKI